MIKNRALVVLAVGAATVAGAGAVAASQLVHQSNAQAAATAPAGDPGSGFTALDHVTSPATSVSPLLVSSASDLGLVDSGTAIVGPPAAAGGLMAFISERGTACYALGDLMSYCYVPLAPDGPAELRGLHFSVSAPEKVGPDGSVHSWVFGLADDQVAAARVEIAGVWRDLPLSQNGLFLDLPGVRQATIGIVQATLKDGSVQSHNVQAP